MLPKVFQHDKSEVKPHQKMSAENPDEASFECLKSDYAMRGPDSGVKDTS